ncbi:MAG: DUF5803 family protein [Halobacteria archaeon]|nr:DUF5803 family protein [Halobacteria archaeon]
MRRAVVLAAVVGIVVLSGCMGNSPGASPGYSWSSVEGDTDVYYDLNPDNYTAVMTVSRLDSSQVELSQGDSFGGRIPVRATHVRFRYPNSTVVNASVETESDRTTVTLPSDDGKLAYTSPLRSNSFAREVPVPVDGDVVVVLPEGKDARNRILGGISPSGYEVVSESPLSLRWSGLSQGDTVDVKFYDTGNVRLLIYLFGAVLAGAVAVVVYFRQRLADLREKRREYEY